MTELTLHPIRHNKGQNPKICKKYRRKEKNQLFHQRGKHEWSLSTCFFFFVSTWAAILALSPSRTYRCLRQYLIKSLFHRSHGLIHYTFLSHTRVPCSMKTIFSVFPTKQKRKSEIKVMRKGRKADLCEGERCPWRRNRGEIPSRAPKTHSLFPKSTL